MNTLLFPYRAASWLCLLMIFGSLFTASAADLKLEVQLVWGTNDEKSPNPSHTLADPSLAKRLAIFKWKKYYLVQRQEVVVPSRSSKRIPLSKQCEIEIKELEGPRIEVNVFGQGKHVLKKTESISKDNVLAIAGDDKNDCAWFIIIKEL